jgi:hypothetical protein
MSNNPVTLNEAVLVRDLVKVIVTNWGSEDSSVLKIAERLVQEKTVAAPYRSTVRKANGSLWNGVM